MRTLILCALVACAPDPGPLEADGNPARGEDPAASADVDIEASCIDEDCATLWFSLVPPSKEPVLWLVDGEEVGFDVGMKLDAPKGGVIVEAQTDLGARVAAATGGESGGGPFTVIQTYQSCDAFRIVAVGGCINGATALRFEAPGLFNPYSSSPTNTDVAFTLSAPNATLVDIGWAWGAWWPSNNAQYRQLNAPPPSVNTPMATNTGLKGLEVRHAVAPGGGSGMSIVHGSSGGTGQTPVYAVACSKEGVPSFGPGGLN